MEPEELVGRAEPGLAKPVIGLPPLVTGRMAGEGPELVVGFWIEVPGLGTAATAFSSSIRSATPY